MDWISDHWIPLAFVFVYVLVLAWHGWLGYRNSQHFSDFVTAGRRFGGVLIALSYYSTFVSTNTFIAGAGKSWDVGLTWAAGGAVTVLFCCISWLLIAPRFTPLTRQYGSLTVADFLGYRYHSMPLRRVAGAIIAIASCIYLVALYRGCALATATMFDMPYAPTVILVCVVVTAYTLAGGFETVVLTDALQGVIMIAGAVALFAAVIIAGGGFANVMASLHAQDPDLISWRGKMPLATIVGIQIAVGMKLIVEPRQLSRFYGLKDARSLSIAAVVTPLLILITFACVLPLGALAHAIVPADAISSSDEVTPYLLRQANVLGPVWGSAFLLVLLSAAMSSISSVQLVQASTIDHDVISPGRRQEGSVGHTRIWLVGASIVSMIIALTPYANDIITLTAFSGSLFAACFFPTLTVGLFWGRVSATGAMTSLLCGGLCTAGWFIAKESGLTEIHEVYVGLIVSTTIYVAAGMLSPRSVATAAQSVSRQE